MQRIIEILSANNDGLMQMKENIHRNRKAGLSRNNLYCFFAFCHHAFIQRTEICPVSQIKA